MNIEKKFEALVRQLTLDVDRLIDDERRQLAHRIVSALVGHDQPMPGRLAEPDTPLTQAPRGQVPADEGSEAPPEPPMEDELGPLPPAGAARQEVLASYLKRHKGRVADAARAMGCSRGALHRLIRKAGLVADDFRTLSRDNVVAQLKLCRGNVSHAANALGCNRGALHRWIKREGISATSFRPEQGHPRVVDGAKLRLRRDEIVAQLKRNEGNVSRAAKAMGCSRGALHRWINEAGITAAEFRVTDVEASHGDHAARTK